MAAVRFRINFTSALPSGVHQTYPKSDSRHPKSEIMNLDSIFAARPTLAVLGDLMLDEWINGDAARISPEAPVPVVRFGARTLAPGGAANVAANLLSWGAQGRICGTIGADEAGRDLTRELERSGLDVAALAVCSARPTTLKTRIVASRQQIVRIDREDATAPNEATDLTLRARLSQLLEGAAALCLSDYDKGLARSQSWNRARETALQANLIVTGGPKPANLNAFAGADLISLNEKEAREAAGFALDSPANVERAGAQLLERAQVKALAITRGGAGVALFARGAEPRHFAAHRVEVFDVAGAGDTFLAGATYALAAGADLAQAVEFGNLAAACSVKHVGVVAVTPAEIYAMAASDASL